MCGTRSHTFLLFGFHFILKKENPSQKRTRSRRSSPEHIKHSREHQREFSSPGVASHIQEPHGTDQRLEQELSLTPQSSLFPHRGNHVSPFPFRGDIGHANATIDFSNKTPNKKVSHNKKYNRKSSCFNNRRRQRNKVNHKTKKQYRRLKYKVSKKLDANKYITNLSSRCLTEAETRLLSKGLSYVPTTSPTENFIKKSLDDFDRSN